ncbi:hypothetical protein POM88_018677 [Heracleum sosnowskyi]|uniref:Protein kinase domain-containing protein n=1 Tax=Heracleum sosnowskyi TaxID=360622 RepID=A0AAD8MZ67_9APIA|nr:hypothetical protein POM88_018677 [Heracleum sosnowskyi]
MDADCVNLSSYAVQQVIAVSSLFSLKHLNDEKLQSVLGHFQKYFDGGVIVENQGAAFGGYGSFLPMHQRCPLVKSDPKTPQISQNYNRPRRVNHPNIIRLYDMIQEPGKIYFVLEFCKGGDLSMFLHKRKGRITESTAKHFLLQLASGLKILRDNNLIHRDLKPQVESSTLCYVFN